MGIVVGVVKHGERRVYAYGTARRIRIYQIGSISKTFTGLLLAQMVTEGSVNLTQPVRELLPAATVRKPGGRRNHAPRFGDAPAPACRRCRITSSAASPLNPAAAYAGYSLQPIPRRPLRLKHGFAREANPPFFL